MAEFDVLPSQYFKPPAENDILWRFQIVDRFEEMLKDRRLYFRCITKWPDQWEGYFPPPVYDLTSADLAGYGNSESSISFYFNVVNGFTLETRHKLFAVCFYNNPNEPEHMWKLYSGVEHGDCVCFQTSFARLRKALEASKQLFTLAKVHYHGKGDFVYPTEILAGGKLVSVGLVKRASFAHEREVRLIFPDEGRKGESGIFETLNPQDLIERVILSPHSNDREIGRVKAIVAQYLPGVEVLESELKQAPDETLHVWHEPNLYQIFIEAEEQRKKVRIRLRRGKVRHLDGTLSLSWHSYYEGYLQFVPLHPQIPNLRSATYSLTDENGKGIIFIMNEILDFKVIT